MQLIRRLGGFRALAILSAFVLLGAGAIALIDDRGTAAGPERKREPITIAVDDELVPPHVEPSPSPSPVPTTPPPKPVTAPKSKPPIAKAPITGDITAYRGLGAWVDVYDYAIRDRMDPALAVAEMSRRGVKTLYLQTGRYKEPADIVNPDLVNVFLDQARIHNIKVIGWYLPGFGDLDRDIRRSLAVLNYTTPAGARFAGFAADIETREEVGGDRLRFNAGIVEYSKRLRAQAPAGAVLGGIVVDAKNNERAPARWEGFPWREIAQHYDVVLSMAYWTVTKSDCGTQYDVAAYMRDVVKKTNALMGMERPIHPIGGIANCLSQGETAAYVNALKELGAVGGSLYDFQTTQANAQREGLWAELARLNQ